MKENEDTGLPKDGQVRPDRRGFLMAAGAGLCLVGLKILSAPLRIASGPVSAGGSGRTRNTSDMTARYWTGGDRLAG